MSQPTSVVFDIGNVLLDWDVRALYRKIFAIEAEMEHFLTHILPPSWNVEQDRGRSWREAEKLQIARFPDHADAIRAFRARWHETITGEIAGSVAVLAALKRQGIPLYAITNFASDTFAEAQVRFPFLATSFSGIVVSGAEGMIKPDERIFRLLLDRHALSAKTCAFIDDSPANVAAAAQLGFHAIHFTSPRQMSEDLRRLGFEV